MNLKFDTGINYGFIYGAAVVNMYSKFMAIFTKSKAGKLRYKIYKYFGIKPN